jgi:hypothetical protein
MSEIYVGQIVQYTLTEEDANQINRRRTTGTAIATRIENNGQIATDGAVIGEQWPIGAQAHIGNAASTGDTLPLLIVRIWPNEFGEGRPGVNGQVFLDRNDTYWVCSVSESESFGVKSAEPKQGQWNK